MNLITSDTTPILIGSHRHTTIVKNAVILAAGKSSRFREHGIEKPKVLMKIGGLRLLERAILSLHAAGIENFRIVVGAYREQVVAEMKKSPRLQGINIEFVVSEQYELGNGMSFGDGAAGFNEAFLLAMSDHIIAPETISEFINKALRQPYLPALACDGNLAGVFDMDDATKVASRDGFIYNIGKDISEYDLVDTGLFYFPAGYGPLVYEKALAGAHSVSSIIQHFMQEDGVRAIALDQAIWQDVDDPSMKCEAERRLMKTLIRPDDGWISRNFNRLLSSRLSFLMANAGVHPNVVTTLVFLMTLVGAWFAASGSYQWIVLGALIFQIASILDGCDGELARLTFRTTRFGTWYERFSGYLRSAIFFEALGISAWKATGAEIYLIAVFSLAALTLYMLGQISSYAWSKRSQKTEELLPSFDNTFSDTGGISGRFFQFWHIVNKQDISAFLTFLLCLVFLYQAMFWLALFGITATAIMVSKSYHAARTTKTGANVLERIDPIYFYILGVVILFVFIFNMELDVVQDSLTTLGHKVFWVFSVAILWILLNTMCIRTLVREKVPFPDLLYNQLTGEAYNTIIPLAGLGGEPYKIKHLTQWLDWHTASRAIVVDRFIHAISGSLFAALSISCMLLVLDMDSRFAVPLTVLAVVFALAGFGIMWLALSAAPSRIAGYVLKKLKIVEEYRSEPLSRARFFAAFGFKFAGRVIYMVELWVIFSILGFTPELMDLVSVAGLISTSASLFFIIPQGLGVNEIGISTALSIVGYSASLGITFGLVRRARMIFWALFGVGLHLGASMLRKLAVIRSS